MRECLGAANTLFSILSLICPLTGELLLQSQVKASWQSDRLRKKYIETYTLPLPAIRPWHLTKILDALRAYIRFCRQHRPELIYANGSRAALYGGIVGRIIGLPVIWHCRTVQRDILLDPYINDIELLHHC